MSRSIGVVDEYTPSGFIDREAMMMDGGRLFFQLTVEDDAEAAARNSLADFEGVVLSIAGTDFSGILRVKRGLSGNIIGFALGTGTEAVIVKPGMLLETPDRKVLTIGSVGTSQTPLLTDIASTRSLSLTAPSGPSAPAFSSTRAGAELAFEQQQTLDAASRAFTEEQAGFNRQADIDAALLREQGANRRDRLDALTRLIDSFLNKQAQAQSTLANLQPDPFRFAAVAGGVAPLGTTPQQGFQQQLQQFASAPTPTVDPNASLPSIESAIQGLTGANVPLPPQVFSAAGGASIPAPLPGQSVAVKVGERGEEILRITAQGVEVIPIAGGMQAGGTIEFPFQPIEFDKSSLFPALSPLLSGGGIRPFDVPKPNMPGINIGLRGTATSPSQALQQFGIRPALFRLPNGSVFVRIGDEIRGVPNPQIAAQLGINFDDLVNVPHARNLQEFGTIGANIQPSEVRGILDAQATAQPGGAFTKFSQPIIEPTTGTLLPAPFTVAEELNRLRLTNPTRFNLLLSAYTTAGVPAAAVLSSIGASLSFGSERGAVGLN